MTKNSRERFTKKLLVEGADDQHVVWALCKRDSVDETFDIIDCKGIENLFDQIPVRLKQSEIDTIGIIVDADADISVRWNRLRAILIECGFNIPELLPNSGLVHKEAGGITIGIWIMPNNNLSGMLEDFISFLVPDGDILMPLVEENLNNIEKEKINKYKLIHKSKAKIHSWLAIQEDPGTPLGLSITKRYLTKEGEICEYFVNWLKTVFEN